MKQHSLKNLSRGPRIAVNGVLVFLASLLLGVTFLPTVSYFWSLALGRLLLSVMLIFFPETNGGRSRPPLLLLGLSTLVFEIIWGPQAVWLPLVLYYLVLEVTVDTMVVENATEQEISLEFGWLAAARLVGLWSGLILANSQGLSPLPMTWLTRGVLVLLSLFWFFSKEAPDHKLLPTAMHPERMPPRTVLEFAALYLRKPHAVGSMLNLIVVSALAGLTASAVLPYPLLHPDDAHNWLVDVLNNMQVLGIGLFLTWLLERLKLHYQLLCVGLGVGLLLLIHDFAAVLVWPYWAWGVLLCGILLSCRSLLRETYRVPALLRGALIVSLWTLGSLGGMQLRQVMSPTYGQWLGALLVLIYSFWAFKRYSKVATDKGDLKPQNIRSERFGDRARDFTAAPTAPTKKKGRRLSSLFTLLLVNIPVTVLLASVFAALLTFGWYLLDEKKSFQKRIDTAVKVFRTELLLNAFSRRLYQDMVASQRVPQDLRKFIAQSFTYEGKPMSDLDAWGSPYQFENVGNDIRIRSAGRDQKFNTADDLTRSTTKPPGTKG